MYMNYLIHNADGRETLMSVIGNEDSAKTIAEAMIYRFGGGSQMFYIKGLQYLLKEKVEIPASMAWLVESDRQHQKREIESRIGNLCDLNFAPKKSDNSDEPSICEVMERAAHRRDGMGNVSD